MAIPLIIAGAGGIVAGVAGAASASKPFIKRFLFRHRDEIEAWAMKNAFEAIGLPDLAEGSPSRADFTEAINQKFLAGSDFKLTNAFSRESVKEDALRYGMQKAASELGITIQSATVKGLSEALGEWVRDQVVAQIGEGGGALIAMAPDAQKIIDMVNYYRKIRKDGTPAPAPGLDMSPEAVSNRLRQAKFRARHKKFWVNR